MEPLLSNSDFVEDISQPTQATTEKGAPTKMEVNPADFEPEKQEINTNTGPGSAFGNEKKNTPEAAKEKPSFSPGFTAEIATETINSLQYTVFFAMNNRKWRMRYFDSKEEYKQAMRFSILSPSEIEKLENKDDVKVLLSRLKKYQEEVTKVGAEIDFTEDQKKRLAKPIMEMSRKYGWDLPPSLAFFLVLGELLIDRTADLIMD